MMKNVFRMDWKYVTEIEGASMSRLRRLAW